MKELDIVALTEDIPELGLKANDTGTVVDVGKNSYTVEFMTRDGHTIAVIPLTHNQVRPISRTVEDT